MNSSVKYARLIITIILFANCASSNKSYVDGHKIHKIDSLPATIIAPINVDDNSIKLADTTSKMQLYTFDMLAQTHKKKELETNNFNSEKALILNNQGLANISSEELKIAVDDFRNNSYLNPDF